MKEVKGILLAGGTGSRLSPCTKVTNKHLLPVYNKPMIYYPLYTLINAGIKDIMIVSGNEYAGDFLRLLGSGKDFGVKLTYEIQDKAGGIAEALSLAENFVDNEKMVVILGDNIFEDNIRRHISKFLDSSAGAMLFLKEVVKPNRFGVPVIKNGKIVAIEEKPKRPKSPFAVTGLYMYDGDVFDIIKRLKPSKRGEYEITDVNNVYIKRGSAIFSVLRKQWSDTGTFESLFYASHLVRNRELKSARMKRRLSGQ